MHEALSHVLKKRTAESASGIMGAESGGTGDASPSSREISGGRLLELRIFQ